MKCTANSEVKWQCVVEALLPNEVGVPKLNAVEW